jgi:hypothetical protein
MKTGQAGIPILPPEMGLMSIEVCVESYYHTHLQPRGCWSFDVEMRHCIRAFQEAPEKIV